jgi:hypothetical protein
VTRGGAILLLLGLGAAAACTHRDASPPRAGPPATPASPVAPESPAAPAPADPAALRLARHGHGLGVVRSTIYAWGGFGRGRADGGRGEHEALAFDLPEGPWRPLPPMARPRAFFGAAILDGRLLALGGGAERYDPATGRWEAVAPEGSLPATHFAAAAVGGRVHAVGGLSREAAVHRVLDPVSGTVAAGPPPPGMEPGDHLPILAVVKGRLHCLGGVSGRTWDLSAAHHVLEGDRWAPRASPPTGVWAKTFVAAAAGDALYLFTDGRGLRYDARTDAWSAAAALPSPRVMASAVVLGGRVYVIGGDLSGEDGDAVLVYDPAKDAWESFR